MKEFCEMGVLEWAIEVSYDDDFVVGLFYFGDEVGEVDECLLLWISVDVLRG